VKKCFVNTTNEKFIETSRKRAVKAFNTLLKDKDLIKVVKQDDGYWCLTFANGQENLVKGFVVDNSLIYEKDFSSRLNNEKAKIKTGSVKKTS
jgi:hypothetical protein